MIMKFTQTKLNVNEKSERSKSSLLRLNTFKVSFKLVNGFEQVQGNLVEHLNVINAQIQEIYIRFT